jgi:N4-gp56 family major capsid protein
MAYAPTTNVTTSANQAHLASVWYRRKALDRLQKKFQFRGVVSKEILPTGSGRTWQAYRFNNLAASSTQTAEGTIGTTLTTSSRTVGVTVSQYSAFITMSDFLLQTSIAPEVTNAAELLGYQAGLSVDNMTRNVIDAENAGCAQTLLGSTFTVADLRLSRAQLQANDVEPFSDGWFKTIMHPFITFDLVNDPTANGLADIMKYNTAIASSPMVKLEDRGHVTNVADANIMESTNVYVNTGVTPNLYRTYVFGDGGVAAVDLAGQGPSDVVDPKRQKFKITTRTVTDSIADPEGTIGAYVSYNFKFATVVTEGPPGIGGQYRMRQIDAASSVA